MPDLDWLPEDCAIVTATLTIVSYLRDDGEQGYAIDTKGDAPMTTYQGLTVVAQQELHKWGTRDV